MQLRKNTFLVSYARNEIPLRSLDSLPSKLVLVVVLVRQPHEEAHGAGEAERGQHEDHEDEEVEGLLHDRQVLRRSEDKNKINIGLTALVKVCTAK